VQGSAEHPSRLKLIDLAPAVAERTMVLASGEVYADEEGAASAAMVGQLNAASVHQDLTGADRPSALVGSTDGWLYAVDPCAGALDWAYEFGSAVGAAVYGDTDGDGRDEILVTAEDGYLYTLRDFEIAAPDAVRDTDPWTDAPEDISELVTASTLEATWGAVDGAIRYEIAVVDHDGNYIGEPWRNASGRTRVALEDLPLEDGETYRVGVRAVAEDGGRSVDTVSDGVWVHVPDLGDPPGGGGCGCRAAGKSGAGSVLLVLLALGLTRRSRPCPPGRPARAPTRSRRRRRPRRA